MSEKKITSLDDFDYPTQVIGWCKRNTKSIPQKDDDEFYFPPRIFREKKCNCIDIAFMLHMWCKSHNIPNRMVQVCFEYKIPWNTCINTQAHVVTAYQDVMFDGAWYVGNISGEGYIEYNSAPTLEKCILNFAHAYLPFLVKMCKKSFRKQFTVTDYYYAILTDKQTQKIEHRYCANNVTGKQKFFHSLVSEVQSVKITDIPK